MELIEENLFTVEELPAWESPVIRERDEIFNPFEGDGRVVERRVTVKREADSYLWAHLLRVVSGWAVVAAGELKPAPGHADLVGVVQYLRRAVQGADGDGIDRLPRAAHMQVGTSAVAHLRNTRSPQPGSCYCGVTGTREAEFDTRVKGHAEQHCIACDRAYRAAHYGATPVTY